MQTTKALAVLASCAFGLISSPAASQVEPRQPSAGTAREIDRFIEQRMGEAGIAGIGAAMIVGRKVAWMKGYGFADKSRAVPFTPDTVMNIGSISKTFTGAALMRAVQDGKLSLDEDINAYLPFRVVNPNHPHAKITLRQLATHTSGIVDREPVYAATYHYGGVPEPLDEFLKGYLVPAGANYSKDNFLDAIPGTNREYSNIAAGLAGYIV
jgi:CubicO group peptidase (beta-lactamase class C family)